MDDLDRLTLTTIDTDVVPASRSDDQTGNSSSSNNSNNRQRHQQRKRRRSDSQQEANESPPPPTTTTAPPATMASPSREEFEYKGNQKQYREDYDSDTSYDKLGLEFKRRRLPITEERKDQLLPAGYWYGTKNKMPIVDFAELAKSQNAPEWGKQLLFEKLSELDINALVGLATTFAAEEEIDPLRLLPIEGTLNDNNDGDNDENDERSNIFQSQRQPLPFQDPKAYNPLIMLPNGPPIPPSIIKHMETRALKQIDQGVVDNNNNNNDTQRLYSCFGDSAAVAIGMVWEEVITASLLPLAGLHVLRCRALENMTLNDEDDKDFNVNPAEQTNETNNVSSNNNNDEFYSKNQISIHPITGEKILLDMNKIKWKEEKSFSQWTLPPEEAIMKLLQQGLITRKSGGYFLSDPCRAVQEIEGGGSNHTSMSDSERIEMWSKRFDLNPEVITANREIFEVFMTPNSNTNDDDE